MGVPMSGTLVAELIILEIGRAMDVPTIKQFCLFAQTALIVEYVLDMTFFIAILAIDVNRAEVKRNLTSRSHLCNSFIPISWLTLMTDKSQSVFVNLPLLVQILINDPLITVLCKMMMKKAMLP